MIKFLPILLAVLYGLAMYRFSVWRTARELDDKSTELADGRLKALCDRMAASLDDAIGSLRTLVGRIEGAASLTAGAAEDSS